LPPCPANDFSWALSGTLAWTVEPEENETPPNFKEAPAASTPEVAMTSRKVTTTGTNNNLFKQWYPVSHAVKPQIPGGKFL